MNPLPSVVRRLRRLFGRSRFEADMAEEMRFHLEQRMADYAADGLSADEARCAAQRRFGNLGSLQEQAREASGWGWLERLSKDLQFALRELWRNPGFTLVAVLTLGLGIGANTAMFSVLNGILLKPLPFADLGRLDRFYRATLQNPEGHFSPADLRDFQQAQDGYGEIAAYTAANASLSEPGQPAEFVYVGRGTTNLFSLLGVQPQLGRDFRESEATPGRDHVVVLSQRVWQNRFGGRPDVLGRTIRLDGEPHVVVGVMSPEFNDWRYLGDIDVFRPLALTPEAEADRRTAYLRILGRRSPARPAAAAEAFVANLGRRLATEHPEVNAGSTWRTLPLQASAGGRDAGLILPMLIGLSGFVLLLACSNLANLLLARTMTRAREFAVRSALGASRLQLLRPLVTESLLLAFAGSALAMLVALWFRDWAAVRSTGDNGEQVHFAIDWRVGAWAFGGALLTSVAFGLAPALFALRLDLNQTLKSGGRGLAGSYGPQRFRRLLIVGQFALAMVLLAGAGLFIRGLFDLNHRRAGWESERLVTGTLLLPAAKYADGETITAFDRLLLERLAGVPGADAVSIAAAPPFYVWSDNRKLAVEGLDRPEPGGEPVAAVNRVSPDYFATVGVRVLAGRGFGEHDTADAAHVFIISQTTARGLFGATTPIGRRLTLLDGGAPRSGEIVGVVNDAWPINADPTRVAFQLYAPMEQEPSRLIEISVRTQPRVAPSVVVASIRKLVTELDPDLPVRKLMHADARIDRANYQLGVLRDVLTAIAALGLGLASLGIYGVITRTMAQRTGEFAIRLALGAALSDLTRIVLASGVKLALIGSMLGLIGALAVQHILSAGFPGMRMDGPVVLAGVTLLLVAVALLACWLPARRAGKIDAMAVLRAE